MLIAVIVNLYASRLLLSTLGVEDYGVYNIIGGVVALMMFLNTAMQTSTVRFITYSIGCEPLHKIKSVVNASIHIHFWIMVLILVLAETVGLWFINTKLNLPEGSMTAVNWVYQCTVFTSCIGILQVPFSSLVISYERMDIYAIFELLHVIIKCGVIFLLPFSKERLIAYALLLLIVGVIFFFLYSIYCKRKINSLMIEWRLNTIVAKPMLSFALWNLYSNGTYAISRQGTNILINKFFGVAANAAGGIATQASSMVSQFVATLQSAFNPQVIKSYSSGDVHRMRDLMIKESEIMILLSALAFTPLFINIDYIMRLWLKEVPDYAVEFCQILLLCNMIQMLTNILSVAIQATGKNRIFSIQIGTINIICVIGVYICFKMKCDAPFAYIVYLFAFLCKLIIEIHLLNRFIPDIKVYKIMLGNLKPICILLVSYSICDLLEYCIDSDLLLLFSTFLVNFIIISIFTLLFFPYYRKKLYSIYNEKIKKII